MADDQARLPMAFVAANLWAAAAYSLAPTSLWRTVAARLCLAAGHRLPRVRPLWPVVVHRSGRRRDLDAAAQQTMKLATRVLKGDGDAEALLGEALHLSFETSPAIGRRFLRRSGTLGRSVREAWAVSGSARAHRPVLI